MEVILTKVCAFLGCRMREKLWFSNFYHKSTDERISEFYRWIKVLNPEVWCVWAMWLSSLFVPHSFNKKEGGKKVFQERLRIAKQALSLASAWSVLFLFFHPIVKSIFYFHSVWGLQNNIMYPPISLNNLTSKSTNWNKWTWNSSHRLHHQSYFASCEWWITSV